jgi:hypothetical protein
MPPYGQAIKETFLIIRDNPNGEAVLSFNTVTTDCCITLPVFGETVFTSDYFNDITAPLFFWGKGFSTANLWLQKYVSGAWVDKVELNVGTWTDASLAYDPSVFGFFTNRFSEKAIGYQLSWALVLNDGALGEGNYRIKSTGTTLIGATSVSKYSLEFCLSEYNANRADETVRVDWWMNGSIGDPDNDKLSKDFGTLNWFNQIRLPDSRFGYNEGEGETSYVRYQTGEMKWLEDSQVKKFTLKTGRFDETLLNYIEKEILQAGQFRITDYNILNPNRNQNRYVVRDGMVFKPVWDQQSLLAPVEIQFQQGYQNLIHKRN